MSASGIRGGRLSIWTTQEPAPGELQKEDDKNSEVAYCHLHIEGFGISPSATRCAEHGMGNTP